jgi:hypothetical protein
MPRAPLATTAGLFAAGLIIRLGGLPLWGTFDTEVQKAWAARAASDGLADIYGPPDDEIRRLAEQRGESVAGFLLGGRAPRTRFHWGEAVYDVDYPPGSLLVLWAAGKVHIALDPERPNRQAFNVAINLAPLVGSILIAGLLAASSREHGRSRSLLFWYNPAILLAAPVLGYQDTIFGALALAAVIAMVRDRLTLATALVVAAGLVKPQGTLLLPALGVLLLRDSGPRTWLKAALAGAATAAVILLPWWSRGYLLSALDGCLRPLTQGTLAPGGLNVWWVAGYLQRWSEAGPWSLAQTGAGIAEFKAWAGWDPVVVGRLALAAATAAILFLLWRTPRSDPRAVPLAVVLQVHAYALLSTSVHENHTLLAVTVAPLLLGVWPRAVAVVAATSGFAVLSLFLSAGFGRRITSQRFLESLRAATQVDLSVLVALGHLLLVVLLFYWAARAGPGTSGAPQPRV